MLGLLTAGLGLAGSLVGARSANKAAEAQTDATMQGIAEERRQYNQTRRDLAPWRNLGTEAIGGINALLDSSGDLTRKFNQRDFGIGERYRGQMAGLTQPYTDNIGAAADQYTGDLGDAQDRYRQAMSQQFEASPGYQWSLDQGREAIERSSAAGAGVLGSATQKSLLDYSQGLAGQEYQNFLNNRRQDALGQYGVDTQTAGSMYGTRVNALTDAFRADSGLAGLGYDTRQASMAGDYARRTDDWNRHTTAAGLGQTATTQGVAAGQGTSSAVAGLYGNIGQAQGARAVNVGNALNSGISNVMGTLGAANMGMFNNNNDWQSAFRWGGSTT